MPARSASISSSSTATSKAPNDLKKKFSCSFPNCGKSFSRSEHLHRHALNHKDGNNTCLRCSAHFRRRDLLDRHMARHKEKDDEAGGEGLGVLATRKRLWRDANGQIVNARRPSYTQEGPILKRRAINRVEKRTSNKHVPHKISTRNTPPSSASSSLSSPMTSLATTPTIPMSRAGSTHSSTIIVDSSSTKYEYPDPEESQFALPLSSGVQKQAHEWLDIDTTLPSPPLSDESIGNSPALSELDGLYEEWPLQTHSPCHIDTTSEAFGMRPHYELPPLSGISESQSVPVQQPFQTFMGAMETLPYDDIFKPEGGVWDWQQWNSQVLMSRCREEKIEPGFAGEMLGLRRGFGMGA
ncbi:hypothetical protein B0O99DRAFT_594687 [Bisporella sp. PMI_857]|nr:hypothetical protein B0O99DRAFT_594687 [Bisporella sp. PMI_857]